MKLTPDEIFDLRKALIEKFGKDSDRIWFKILLPNLKLRELVEKWATDESYSWSETCKELLEESKK